eukprot:XP_008663928.2 uncharacterized protein LOC103642430 [Zea mays]
MRRDQDGRVQGAGNDRAEGRPEQPRAGGQGGRAEGRRDDRAQGAENGRAEGQGGAPRGAGNSRSQGARAAATWGAGTTAHRGPGGRAARTRARRRSVVVDEDVIVEDEPPQREKDMSSPAGAVGGRRIQHHGHEGPDVVQTRGLSVESSDEVGVEVRVTGVLRVFHRGDRWAAEETLRGDHLGGQSGTQGTLTLQGEGGGMLTLPRGHHSRLDRSEGVAECGVGTGGCREGRKPQWRATTVGRGRGVAEGPEADDVGSLGICHGAAGDHGVGLAGSREAQGGDAGGQGSGGRAQARSQGRVRQAGGGRVLGRSAMGRERGGGQYRAAAKGERVSRHWHAWRWVRARRGSRGRGGARCCVAAGRGLGGCARTAGRQGGERAMRACGLVHAGDGGGRGRREGKQRGLAAAQGQARTNPAAQQGGRGRRGRRRGAPAAGEEAPGGGWGPATRGRGPAAAGQGAGGGWARRSPWRLKLIGPKPKPKLIPCWNTNPSP